MPERTERGRFIGVLAAGAAGSAQARLAWAIWALMSLATLWFVVNYGMTFPYGDEWSWLPWITGQRAVSWQWLWAQHVDHRMVLPRLIYVGLGKLSGFNFQAGSFYSVFLLSAASSILMLAARAVRGSSRLCDAFFPLLLLHWGQYINIGWGFQLNFITSVFIACIILAMIARCGERLSWRPAAVISLCLIGQGLCGGFGLAYIPAIAAWMAVSALLGCRRGEPGAVGRCVFVMIWAALPVAFVALYFVGFKKAPAVAPWPGLYESIRTALQFLSGCIGPMGKETWPVSGVLVVGACLLAAWHSWRTMRERPKERVRVLGMLFFLAAIGCLAAAIGFGRAYEGPMAGFMPRYMSLAMTFACCLFLMSVAYFPALTSRRLQHVMFAAMCVLMLLNARKGIRYAEEIVLPMRSLAADAAAGVPPGSLSIRYREVLGFGRSEEKFAECFAALEKARLAPFDDRSPDGRAEFCRIGMLRCDTSSAKLERIVELTAGETFVQEFQVPGKAKFSRIDVKLSKWRKGRCVDRLDWALSAVAEDGTKVALRDGRIDLAQLRRYSYAKLCFQPVETDGDGRFELSLSVPGDETDGKKIDFPLYGQSGSGDSSATYADTAPFLGAFIYFSACPNST